MFNYYSINFNIQFCEYQFFRILFCKNLVFMTINTKTFLIIPEIKI